MTRRLRKFSRHHPSEDGDGRDGGKRVPYGLIWLVLTIVVLVAVLMYDRRSISAGEDHIATGRELEKQGLYVEALDEFEAALKNRRLSRKARAQAAVSMAEIYFSRFDDFPAAHRYYVQAKQESPGVVAAANAQERAKLAAVRAQGAGVFRSRMTAESEDQTTRTIVQRVELISEPLSDREGPVVARYNGGQIHAGQLLRELQARPEFHRANFREDPEKLKAYVQGMLRTDMAYEAAVSSGVHKDPDVSARLYDYQRQLVTQRYLTDRRDMALRVDNADVEEYYRANPREFQRPGYVQLSMIKTDTESSATEYLSMLRDGAVFQDLATSFSVDQETAAKRGVVGLVRDDATTITGVGVVPDVVKGLFRLPVFSVSDVVRVGDKFFIFRIDDVVPARHVTLAEARRTIEQKLRGSAVDNARHRLDAELEEAFEPELEEDVLLGFWDYVAARDNEKDAVSTGTAVLAEDEATSPPEASKL